MSMTPDERQIRVNRVRERMKELSEDGDATPTVEDPTEWADDSDDELEEEEFELRCEARKTIHEYVAYEKPRTGSEWRVALSILRQGFESERFGFEDELANSMLGLEYILAQEKNRDDA